MTSGKTTAFSSGRANLVRLGATDLYVSRLCQGTAFRTSPRQADNDLAQQALNRCIELGVNFFNSSNAYGWGGSEEVLGKAIAGRRDEVVICTKLSPGTNPSREEGQAKKSAFTRDFIFDGAEGSLRRLGTDYIDLYLLHSPDQTTPFEEVVDSMDLLVQSGKVRYWGVSNHTPEQVTEFVELGRTMGKALVTAIEDYYTIAGVSLNKAGKSRVRDMERNMFPVLRRENLGLLAFSPMDQGYLTPGREVDPNSPLPALIDVIDSVASELEVTRAEVCFAWVMTHPEVTSVLGGSGRPSHVEQAVSGANMVLHEEAVKRLNTASHAFSSAQESGDNA